MFNLMKYLNARHRRVFANVRGVTRPILATVISTVATLLLIANRSGEATRPETFIGLGKDRALWDVKHHIYYAENDFGLPLIASAQSSVGWRLLVQCLHDNRSNQNKDALAFISGYRGTLIHLKRNAIISHSPLIVTFMFGINYYAATHHGRLPIFHSASELESKLRVDQLGLDPYASTCIKYGTNNALSAKKMDAVPGSDLFIWVVPPTAKGSRMVAFANGDVQFVTYAKWRSMLTEQGAPNVK